MKTKIEIRNLFLDRFRILRCKSSQGFMANQIYTLNLTQEEFSLLIDEIIPMLEESDICVFDNNFFRLTEKGYDKLYKEMKTEYEMANIVFDVCRKFGLKSNQVIKWITVTDYLRKVLNPKEFDLALLVVEKLCKKEYIRLESDSRNIPQWLRLLELGYDYMYDENSVLDLSIYIQIIPDGVDIASNEAFNSMWEWVGNENAPKYLTGSMLYKMALEVNKVLPPTYNLFLDKRRENNQSTTRKVWFYEFFCSLKKEQKERLFDIIESYVNQIEPAQESPVANDIWGEDIETEAVNNVDTIINEPKIVSDAKAELQQKEEYHPSVLISYSWDNKQHKQWVLNLANRLCKNGVYVYLDQFDLTMGKDMTHFMEEALSKSDRILVIGTPTYKKRAMEREKGVGFEYSIITATLMNDLNTDRFIPILRVGPKEEALPLLLQSRIGVFMEDDEKFENAYEELLRAIYDEPKVRRPPLGNKPDFSQKM